METLKTLDIQLFRLVNQEWTHPAMDRLMAVVSDFGLWMWPLLAGAVLLAVFGKFRARTFLVLSALALLVGDAGVVQGVRAVVNRPRPWQALENVRYVDLHGVEIRNALKWERGRSMPSGHVCNNTAIATLVILLYGWRPLGLLMALWALLMGYSRVYTGAHYPGDVLVSIPLAAGYAWAIYGSAEWLWQRFAPRFIPALYQRRPSLRPEPARQNDSSL